MAEVGQQVSVVYEGRLADGTIFDNSQMHEGRPLVFVIGARTVIPGIEKAVCGMEPHVKHTVTVPAVDAYGEYNEGLRIDVASENFPDADKLPVGEFIMLDLGGERQRAKVLSVDDGVISFDFNHEFAGRDLTFDLEIVDILGETGSLVENEKHAANCTCGCHKLKEQLLN